MVLMDASFYHHLLDISLAVLMLFSALHALLNKRDSRAALGWVVVCFVFNGLGAGLYWILGVNRVKTHARHLKERGFWRQKSVAGQHHETHLLPPHHSFRQELGAAIALSEKVTNRPLMLGNLIEILPNGEKAYPAMIAAIEGAKHFVYLSSYIFDADISGMRFVRALEGAKKRGVEVRVLVDALGMMESKGHILGEMKRAEIKAAQFLPLLFSRAVLHFNLRNHRKILVVDGTLGFTGGMNLGDRHLVESGDLRQKVQDLHFQFEGPLVNQFQEVMIEDWYFATRESLPWKPYPAGKPAGNAVCRGVADGPGEDYEKLNWILLGVLSWAKKSVKIMTPYFVPSRELIAALNTAALRGIKVEIILPSGNNHRFVDWACQALLWEMLQKGVRFYEQPHPFAHTKYLVADGMYSLVGSANMDNRSLRLNFEFDVEVFEPSFAGKLDKHFEEVKRRAREITLPEMDGQAFGVKVRNRLAKLISPYL